MRREWIAGIGMGLVAMGFAACGGGERTLGTLQASPAPSASPPVMGSPPPPPVTPPATPPAAPPAAPSPASSPPG